MLLLSKSSGMLCKESMQKCGKLVHVKIEYYLIWTHFHYDLIRLNLNPKYFRQNYTFFSRVY